MTKYTSLEAIDAEFPEPQNETQIARNRRLKLKRQAISRFNEREQKDWQQKLHNNHKQAVLRYRHAPKQRQTLLPVKFKHASGQPQEAPHLKHKHGPKQPQAIHNENKNQERN